MSTKREILELVAQGELTPEEASIALDEGASEPVPPVPPVPPTLPTLPTPPTPPTPPTSVGPFAGARIARIRLVGAFQTAKIVADPTVRTAVADGPHTARIDGDALVIDGHQPDGVETFRFSGGRSSRSQSRVRIGFDSRPIPLKVRMNPDLPLDAELAAGTLTVTGVHGPIRAEVSAGACKLEDVRGPIDVTVATGAVKIQGILDRGDSTIRCETGGVKVILDPASSVKIRARAGLGRVSLPGASSPTGIAIGSASTETTIGDGAGSLVIECSLGAVKVLVAEPEGADRDDGHDDSNEIDVDVDIDDEGNA